MAKRSHKLSTKHPRRSKSSSRKTMKRTKRQSSKKRTLKKHSSKKHTLKKPKKVKRKSIRKSKKTKKVMRGGDLEQTVNEMIASLRLTNNIESLNEGGMTIIIKDNEIYLVVRICSYREGEETSTLRNVYLKDPEVDSTTKGIINKKKRHGEETYVFSPKLTLDGSLENKETLEWKIMVNETLKDLNDNEYVKVLKSLKLLKGDTLFKSQNHNMFKEQTQSEIEVIISKILNDATESFWSNEFMYFPEQENPKLTNHNFDNAQTGEWYKLKSTSTNNIPFTISSLYGKTVIIIVVRPQLNQEPHVAYALPPRMLEEKKIIIYDENTERFKFSSSLKKEDIIKKLTITLLRNCLLYHKDDTTYHGIYGKIQLDDDVPCHGLNFSINHDKLFTCFTKQNHIIIANPDETRTYLKPSTSKIIEPNANMRKLFETTYAYPSERKLTFSKPTRPFPLRRGVLYMEKNKDKDYLVFKQFLIEKQIDIEIKIPTEELLKNNLLLIGQQTHSHDRAFYYFKVGKKTTDKETTALILNFNTTIQEMIRDKVILDAHNNPITAYNEDSFNQIKARLII